MKQFSHHFLSAVKKLIRHVMPSPPVALEGEGGVDCAVFDEAHREAWHQAGFTDEEVHALCIAVSCCDGDN